jgi:HSP20 family protein
MSLLPFRSVIDDPFNQDWMIFDPFRDLSTGFRSGGTSDIANVTKPFAPLLTTDVIEGENEFKVMADLPGIDPNELELNVDREKHLLVMKAERKQVHETNTDRIHRMERSYGKVHRTIRLPRSADVDNASCNYKDGVLCVCVPKLTEIPETTKKLTIGSA